jgi:signal transduction histidine kinase
LIKLLAIKGLHFNANAQSVPKIDSLLKKLPFIKDEKTKFDVLADIAYKYLTNYPDSAFPYIEEAEKIALKTRDKYRIALIINRKGLAYFDKGELVKSLQLIEESLGLAEDIDNQELIAQNYGHIGLIYLATGNSRLAIYYYRKSLDLYEKLKNNRRIALVLSNIGNAFIDLNLYDSAKHYVDKAFPLAQKYAPTFLSFAWFNLGKINLHYQKYNLARQNAQEAIKLAEEYFDKQDLTWAYLLLAEVDLAEKKLDLALKYSQKALSIAESTKRKRDMFFSFDLLSKILAANQKFEKAYQYRDSAAVYKDSLQAETTHNALQIFEYEKKQRDLALLKTQQLKKNNDFEQRIIFQRTLTTFILIILGLSTVGIIYIYQSRQKIRRVHLNLQNAYIEIKVKQDEIVAQNEELYRQQEEINSLNNHLEELVKTKTATIIKRNEQLDQYAHFNAHKLRAPIATVLGLYQLLKLNPDSQEKEIILEKMELAVNQLDKMVKRSQELLDDIED